MRTVNSISVWKAYVYSTDEHADWVLHNRPDLILNLSYELLQSSPRNTIPYLLEIAPDDKRPEHTAPEHPIRRIRDWVQSGYPGRDAVQRRQITLSAFTDYLSCGGDVNLAAPLIPIIVSPLFDDTEQDPGDRMRYRTRRGGLLAADLAHVELLWNEIFERLAPTALNKWKSVLQAVESWMFPHFGMVGVSDDQRFVIERSAVFVLNRAIALAEGHPGALTSLRWFGWRYESPIEPNIDPTFAILFPGRPRGDTDWKTQEEHRLWTAAVDAGRLWATEDPITIIQRIQWCITESEQMLDPWPDLCRTAVEAIADTTDCVIPWIDAVSVERARPDLLTHLLVLGLRRDELVLYRDFVQH